MLWGTIGAIEGFAAASMKATVDGRASPRLP
jgi:hypothetical protein